MISVILPTYNEAENIIPMLQEVLRFLGPEDEVLVVDDDSPDQTYSLVARHYKDSSQVKAINRRGQKPGLTLSLQCGIERSKGDVVIWMDSDLSQPPALIPLMLKKLAEGQDLVVGSRYAPGGRDSRFEGAKWLLLAQLALSWLLYQLCRWALDRRFRDWSSGYVACRRQALLELLPLQGDYGEYFMHLIYHGLKRGLHVLEVPYDLKARQKGLSKTATNTWGLFKRGWKYLYWILRLRLEGP